MLSQKSFLIFKKDVSCKTQNQLKTSQTRHKPTKSLTNQPNHPHASQIPGKPPTIQPIMSRKLVFYVTKNFSHNAKHVLSLQTFYFITLTFSSEDQSQLGIEGK